MKPLALVVVSLMLFLGADPYVGLSAQVMDSGIKSIKGDSTNNSTDTWSILEGVIEKSLSLKFHQDYLLEESGRVTFFEEFHIESDGVKIHSKDFLGQDWSLSLGQHSSLAPAKHRLWMAIGGRAAPLSYAHQSSKLGRVDHNNAILILPTSTEARDPSNDECVPLSQSELLACLESLDVSDQNQKSILGDLAKSVQMSSLRTVERFIERYRIQLPANYPMSQLVGRTAIVLPKVVSTFTPKDRQLLISATGTDQYHLVPTDLASRRHLDFFDSWFSGELQEILTSDEHRLIASRIVQVDASKIEAAVDSALLSRPQKNLLKYRLRKRQTKLSLALSQNPEKDASN